MDKKSKADHRSQPPPPPPTDDDDEQEQEDTDNEDDDEEEGDTDPPLHSTTAAEDTTHETSESVNEPASKKKKKRKRGRLTLVKKVKVAKSTNEVAASSEKDMAQCRALLNDLMRNENAWPFAEKVNPDDYPNYYEVIKEPMDLQSIKAKFKAPSKYETKEQFAYDCRLIFDNCEFFNEDESEIGRAGHKLRAFFETKWIKLFD